MIFCVITIHAQWTQGKNKGYFKLCAWNLDYDQYYDNNGKIQSLNERNQFNLNLYSEFGITEKLDVIAFLPFYAAASDRDLDNSFNSFGDIELGFHYSFLKRSKWSFSSKLILGIPSGNSLYQGIARLQTGDGEFNQLITLNAGYSSSLGDRPIFIQGYYGFNNRTNNFSDEIRYGVTGGINLFENKFWFIAKLDRVHSLNNGNFQNSTLTPGSIFSNNVEFSSLGLELNYLFDSNFGFSLQLTTAFEGRNIAANSVLSSGLFYQLK